MTRVQESLSAYNRWTAQLPNISPFAETDNILDVRDTLEKHKSELSAQELETLAEVDARVRRHPRQIVERLGVDPIRYRKRRRVPGHYWWRHLDLIHNGENMEAAA